MKRVLEIDQDVFNWVATRNSTQAHGKLAKYLKLTSKTADGHFYPLILLLMFWLDNANGYLFLYTAVVAYALELPLYLFLKSWFKRPRPCDLIFKLDTFVEPADKFSLPSGHTAAAFLMATIIAYFYPSVAIFVLLWACAVGVSRIVLRVHYPMDVLAGAALGISVSLLSIMVLN